MGLRQNIRAQQANLPRENQISKNNFMKFDMNHDISDDVQIVVAKPQEQNQEDMRDIMKKLQNDLQSLEKLRIKPVMVAQTKPTEPAKMKELMKKIREDMK